MKSIEYEQSLRRFAMIERGGVSNGELQKKDVVYHKRTQDERSTRVMSALREASPFGDVAGQAPTPDHVCTVCVESRSWLVQSRAQRSANSVSGPRVLPSGATSATSSSQSPRPPIPWQLGLDNHTPCDKTSSITTATFTTIT